MTSTEWEPFGLSDDERETYAVLLDGVPESMREPLFDWLMSRLDVLQHATTSALRVDRCLAVQTESRVPLGVQAALSGPYILASDVYEVLTERRSERDFLRVIDASLAVNPPGRGSSAEQALETILMRSRSKWTVGDRMGRRGLVERVPSGVQEAVEAVIDTAGAAGRLIARAWAHVHGLEPNDSAAYHDAVKAVETVATPLVVPRQREPVIGQVIGQMKNDGDWRLPLREDDDAPTADVLLGMLRALNRGQRDRHGAADYADVSHEEASAAVLLAATLVGWFASGAITRRPTG